MIEWVNIDTSGIPKKAGTYLVASSRTKEVCQARFKPRSNEWKFPSASMAFQITHWTAMPCAPSDGD